MLIVDKIRLVMERLEADTSEDTNDYYLLIFWLVNCELLNFSDGEGDEIIDNLGQDLGNIINEAYMAALVLGMDKITTADVCAEAELLLKKLDISF